MFLLSRRWILFAIVVAVLALLAYRLGEWQFDRLEERTARNEVVRTNLVAEPVPVEEVLDVGAEVAPSEEWRRVTATGVYDQAHSVVIRYQTHQGRSGVDVVTPLVTSEGPALLVNRGWLPTGNVGTANPELPDAPVGEVRVIGWVRADGTGRSTQVHEGSARAVSSVEIGRTLPYPVYGGFVERETESPAPDEPLVRTETPDLTEGPHFFYGLQWWFFAALAVFGFGYLAWDERRKAHTR